MKRKYNVDVNSRPGRIVDMEPAGETSVVRAQVPMAEMLTYESSRRSMSGGPRRLLHGVRPL